MWQKIKGFLALIGACIISVLLTLLFRSCSDGRGSSGASDRDREVKEGIDQLDGGISGIEERANRAKTHLERAEEILRRAVERSKST